METKIITLNAAQAKALAHWVRTFGWEHNLDDDLKNPKNAQFAMLYDYIQQVANELNPPKIRLVEEA